MKNQMLFSVLIIMYIFGSTLSAHEVIENPGKILNADGYRIITAKKIMTITDENENYFFKQPSKIKISPDNSIFLLSKDQLLKFSADGKFVKNFIKRGQGPAEAVQVSNYILSEDNSVYIHNASPNKVLHFKGSGEFINEVRIPIEKYFDLIHINKDFYYFLELKTPSTKGKAKVVTIDRQMSAISRSDLSIDNKFTIPIKKFAWSLPNGMTIMITTSYLLTCRLKDNLFYFCNTQDYSVKAVDVNKKEIVSEFNRKYRRVKLTEDTIPFMPHGKVMINGRLERSPLPEYLNDIQSLHVINGKLLVVTSTTDKEKGVLVDVFNEQGKFIDCFYLNLAGRAHHYNLIQTYMAVTNEAVYLIDKDESENWVIVKYLVPFKSF